MKSKTGNLKTAWRNNRGSRQQTHQKDKTRGGKWNTHPLTADGYAPMTMWIHSLKHSNKMYHLWTLTRLVSQYITEGPTALEAILMDGNLPFYKTEFKNPQI